MYVLVSMLQQPTLQQRLMTIKDYKKATEELRAVRRELRDIRIDSKVPLDGDAKWKLLEQLKWDFLKMYGAGPKEELKADRLPARWSTLDCA